MHTHPTPHSELIGFVLDRAQEESPRKRARLYRALAEVCGRPEERDELVSLASNLEKADGLCCEFILSFHQKQSA